MKHPFQNGFDNTTPLKLGVGLQDLVCASSYFKKILN